MLAPSRNASYQATVKCSSCAVEIELTAVAEHVCSQAVFLPQSQLYQEPLSIPLNQPQYEERSQYELPVRSNRPALPKIDSSLAGRSGLKPSEAASIAHDLGLPSPLSAGGSGPRSPRRSRSRSRKTPVPRAPSPEGPLSQDCAFPPFPLKPKRSQNDRENRSHKPHSNSRSTTSTKQHSSSQSNASSVYSNTSGPIKRKTSNTSSGQRSRHGTIDDSLSSISTAPSSPLRLSREQSLDQTQFSSSSTSNYDNCLSEPSSSASTMPPTPLWPHEKGEPSPKILQSPNSDNVWTPSERPIPEETLPDPDIQIHIKSNHNKLETFDRILSPQQIEATGPMFDNPPKQPLYKAKRPPPLLQSHPITPSDSMMPLSARAPPPPPPPPPVSQSSNGLTRTLTNLFGRKRSQSTAAKNMPLPSFDSPRMRALAPDPPERPKRGESLWDDATLARFSDNTEIPSSPRQESDLAQATNTPAVEVEIKAGESHKLNAKHSIDAKDATEFDFKFGTGRSTDIEDGHHEDDIVNKHEEQTRTIPNITQSGPPETEQDLRRASIDSASSYGSIGFSTKRTTSSRSSPPTSVDIGGKIDARLQSNKQSTPQPSIDSSCETPLPSHTDDIMPESPTDPLLHAGKLSPLSSLASSQWLHAVEPSKPPPVDPIRTTSPAEGGGHPKNSRPNTPAGVRGRCRGCSEFIVTGQKSVSSADGRLKGRYHKDCFVCQTCKAPFATADFYVFNDQPYCGHHYHVLNDTLCTACGYGIEGEYFETSDVAGSSSKKIHPKCLQCTTCKMQLNEDYFEFHGRVFCEKDAFRAASGPRSPYATTPSRPSPLVREVINSGEPGLKGRFPERRTTRLMMT